MAENPSTSGGLGGKDRRYGGRDQSRGHRRDGDRRSRPYRGRDDSRDSGERRNRRGEQRSDNYRSQQREDRPYRGQRGTAASGGRRSFRSGGRDDRARDRRSTGDDAPYQGRGDSHGSQGRDGFRNEKRRTDRHENASGSDGRRSPRRPRPYREHDDSQGRDRRRDEREQRVPKPGTAPARDEPETPSNFDEALLPAGVKAELKGLPKDLAETVGAHIMAAGSLLEVDPELAYRHAEAARRRAGRLPVVREAAAEAAYASGHYDVALREFRAIRRMNGGDELLPVIADCERALGRHRDALGLLATLNPRTTNVGLRIECLLVEAGIRDDMGQRGEALRLLKSAIAHKTGPKQGQARLRYAYAALLEDSGQLAAAREWFNSAARLDADARLDVADRVAQLDGVVLPDDFELDEDHPDPEDTTETEVIQLVSVEEEVAEVLAEIDEENQA